jgi:hypothetical protein
MTVSSSIPKVKAAALKGLIRGILRSPFGVGFRYSIE